MVSEPGLWLQGGVSWQVGAGSFNDKLSQLDVQRSKMKFVLEDSMNMYLLSSLPGSHCRDELGLCSKQW